MSQILQQMASLRFQLVKGPKGRRQRIRLMDKLTGRVIAKFDEEQESLALQALENAKQRYIRETENELATKSVPVVANA